MSDGNWELDSARLEARNGKTTIADLDRSSSDATSPEMHLGPDVSFEEAFTWNYPRIRASLARRLSPGLAVFAASGAGIHAETWRVAPPPGELPRTIVIGRHGQADLFLPMDPALSLRHAMVLVRRDVAGVDVRVRAVDLRSEAGMKDEEDRPLSGVEFDGPFFLTCARMRLLIFPTPVSRHLLLDDPADAWRRLPPRRCADSPLPIGAPSSPQSEVPPSMNGDRRHTTFSTIALPQFSQLRSALAEGETALGDLTLFSPFGIATLSVGEAAVRAGLLLGKYDRCASAGLDVLRGNQVSRVHALVLATPRGLGLFDTASTNGVVAGGRRERSVLLTPGVDVVLGDVLATWRRAS